MITNLYNFIGEAMLMGLFVLFFISFSKESKIKKQ